MEMKTEEQEALLKLAKEWWNRFNFNYQCELKRKYYPSKAIIEVALNDDLILEIYMKEHFEFNKSANCSEHSDGQDVCKCYYPKDNPDQSPEAPKETFIFKGTLFKTKAYYILIDCIDKLKEDGWFYEKHDRIDNTDGSLTLDYKLIKK